ncbi:MAG: site-2 protease family protein [Clostridia bacterium]|nr:site-2 protease family protein [Clostridia bacterium]
MTILIAILVFGVLIFIHELGHYLTARLFDVHILEFAIGMGPKLLSRKSKKTGIVYSLRLLPFGGFVSMVGEDDEGLIDAEGNPVSEGGAGSFSLPEKKSYGDEEEPVEAASAEETNDALPAKCSAEEGGSDGATASAYQRDPRALSAKPVWQRMIVTAAGAVMNLLLGVILAVVLVLSMDRIGSTVVGPFDENALSQTQGLQSGDVITHVNGKRVNTHMDLAYAISHDGYEPVELTIRRGADIVWENFTDDEGNSGSYIVSWSGGEEIVLEGVTFGVQETEGVVMGVQDFRAYAMKKTFANVLAQTFSYTRLAGRQVIDGILDLLTGRYGMEQMSGPVGVTQQIGQAASMGLTTFVYLVMVITVNLGIFNLLPLPALDGGRFFFQLIELIFRKPIPRRWEGRIHLIGLALLLLLMVVITGQDIIRIFAK